MAGVGLLARQMRTLVDVIAGNPAVDAELADLDTDAAFFALAETINIYRQLHTKK